MVLFEQFLDLLGQPPGSLVYHFIILFALEAALAIGFGQWLRERDPGTGRLTIAILGIFAARSLVLIAALLAWRGVLPRDVLLPPIERAGDTLTILGLLWAFTTMDDPLILRRNFGPDVVAGVLVGIIFAGFAGSYYFWLFTAPQGQMFNGLWLDSAWMVGQIILSVVGLVWMLSRIRYVYDSFLKGVMLILLGGAAGLQLVQPPLGDVAAAVRIGQVLVMPMLAALTYRHVVDHLLHYWDAFEPSRASEAESLADKTQPRLPSISLREAPLAAKTPPGEQPPVGEQTPVEGPPKPAVALVEEIEKEEDAGPEPPGLIGQPQMLEVVDALGGLLSTLEETQAVREAAKAVATALRADISVVAIVDEQQQQAGIVGGYDNIAQQFLPQAVLELADHPTIVKSLSRLRQMRLTPQRNSAELRDLFTRLEITHEGPAYFQPLVKDKDRIGVLIVALPYSERQFSNEERNLLVRFGPLVTAALLNAERYQDLHEENERAMLEESVRTASLHDELTAAMAELGEERRQGEEMKAYIRDIHRQLDVLPEQQAAARQQIEELSDEVERLRQEGEEAAALREEYERLKEEASRLGELEEANKRLKEEAGRVAELERELERLQDRYEARRSAMSAGPLESHIYERQLEEARLAAQSEIASLRARLAHAAISQQEVAFLQEQLAVKARESISLQTRLTEAQAMVDALREQIRSGGASTRHLETLQMRVATQAAEISSLQNELTLTQASAGLDAEALKQQEIVEQIDRDAVTQLEAQLAERAALVETLQGQLAEKNRAIGDLRSHMAEVESSLRNLETQLSAKTEEIYSLHASLTETRDEAQERIATLQAELEAGVEEPGDERQARVAALEAELADKSTAVEQLEQQLQNTTHSMSALEAQLNATNDAVDAAISGARAFDSHDEVIASMAQELRTPMSAITGYTELLLRESVGILGALQRKFLQRVKSNTDRMGAMLDDLIRVTAVDTGRLELETETVDVAYAIEEVVMNVAGQYREKELTLRFNIAENLPPLKADRAALLQILGNLLTNAALASPVKGEVHLLADRRRDTVPAGEGGWEVEANCLYLAVEDSGTGIDPDEYEGVFSRKYLADSPLIEGLGDTGVGLSMAKTLVDAHGGRIWLESRAGAGTTFYVLIPLRRPQGERK
jgi:signal transduction histidine kinase